MFSPDFHPVYHCRTLALFRTQTLKYNDIAKPHPEDQPYPWVGRADQDLIVWQQRARTFQRRQRDNELKIANQKLKDSCARIQRKESALVKAELQPATRAAQQQYKLRATAPPSQAQQQRALSLHRTCPGLFRELQGGAPLPAASASGAILVAPSTDAHLSMYTLDGLLFPAVPRVSAPTTSRHGVWVAMAFRGVEEWAGGLERGGWGVGGGKGGHGGWKDRVRKDLVTEIAVVLGLGEEEVCVDKVWRQVIYSHTC